VLETAKDKKIVTGLNKLLEANDRLDSAIDATRKHWERIPKCWIDKTLEPTPLLEKHRIRNETKPGF
jgi:hypothetical protein